jgi:A/G-specific DNA glycosylase
VHGWRHRSLV